MIKLLNTTKIELSNGNREFTLIPLYKLFLGPI